MSVSDQTVRDAAMKQTALFPVWSEQSLREAPPSSLTHGINVSSSCYALARVKIRNNPGYQTAVLSIDTFSAGEDLTITVNGNDVVGNESTVDDLLTSLETQINALSLDGVSVVVSHSEDTIAIGVASPNHYEVTKQDSGSMESTLVAEPSTCAFQIWFLPEDAASISEWSLAGDAQYVVSNNWTDRFRTAGYARMCIQVTESVYSGDERIQTYIAPAYEEAG